MKDTLDDLDFEARHVALRPNESNRFLLRPGESSDAYDSWAGINDRSHATDWSGVLGKRLGPLMDHDADTLWERMRQYCDPSIGLAELCARRIGPVLDAARFDAARARNALREAGGITAGKIARISLYPFDDAFTAMCGLFGTNHVRN